MKYINFKRLNFSTITKYINNLRYNFLKIIKLVDLNRFNLKKIYKYFYFPRLGIPRLNIPRFNIPRFNIPSFNISRILKNINLINYRTPLLHTGGFLLFAIFSYLLIPVFYKYDKSEISKVICKDKDIQCLIKGKVGYSLYPTPRINIYDLVIKDSLKEKKTLLTAEKTSLKLKIFNNLLNKKKHSIKKIELSNYDINFYLNNIKKYKSIFKENITYVPISFNDGRILFLDKKDYVASINKSNFDLVYKEDKINIKIKGNFLDENIYIDTKTKRKNEKVSSDIIVKVSKFNLLIKANAYYQEKNKDIIKGNFLLKKDKNRITSIFSYKANTLNLIKSKLTNNIMEGKAEGKINFLPYFNFDIDLSLNNLNFTKLYNTFLFLDDDSKKDIFSINRKLNGTLNLSSDKIYSNNDLVRSFESRLKFNNSNIIIEQFILNLGKLGAADIIGKIAKSKKSNNFKFESNIYVDNQKKFLSKFGIYNKKVLPPNMFVAGNFDLEDLKMHFYELFFEEKLKNQDVNYVEKEFNNLMLEDGYKTLFNFSQFKEFVKSITKDDN